MEMILDRLKLGFKPWRRHTDDPFLLLVAVILSQNTNDRNSMMAYDRLVTKFRTPQQFADADVAEIKKLIRVSGLYREKSKRIKEIARLVLRKYSGDLGSVLRRPMEEARRELLAMKGVGAKTADVVLAFGAGRDVFPVDTHVFRISKRLGFAAAKDDHEAVRAKVETVTPVGRRVEGHMLFIKLGRRYCRARNPLHVECPINKLCPIGISYVRRARH